VPDLQAEIPQHVQDVFDDLVAPGCLLVGEQEEQIDVGTGGEGAAAITADRHHRHVLGGRAVLGAVDMRCGKIVERTDELVHQMREPGGADRAAAILHQHLLGDAPAFEDARLDERAHLVPDLRGGAVAAMLDGERREIDAQPRAIDHLIELQGYLRHLSRAALLFGAALKAFSRFMKS
jgi:hypothetical protein